MSAQGASFNLLYASVPGYRQTREKRILARRSSIRIASPGRRALQTAPISSVRGHVGRRFMCPDARATRRLLLPAANPARDDGSAGWSVISDAPGVEQCALESELREPAYVHVNYRG